MKSKTLLSLLAATGAFLNAEMTSAQTLPPSVRTPQADRTLGTKVSGNGNNFNITGGLNRGQTLFHSFKDFSIPTGGAANFNNPAGTRDIITRVTGSLFSDVNGTLNSNGANFLLINPNGVVFGPNARLNVGKAFAASTANGVELFDGKGQQYTFGTKPGGDAPLLKINPNVFLNISRLNMGGNVPKNPGIVNYGKLQTNNDSQYIGLIGGNVTLDGKYGEGKIVAPGGRVDLGGLNTAGSISTNGQGLVFGGNGLTRGDVLLTNDGLVTVRANSLLGTVSPFFSDRAVTGSNININANNLNVLNSGAKSATGLAAIDAGLAKDSVIKTAPAGDININATGQINLDNADIKNTLRANAEGKIGDININANSLNLINQSILSTSTAGKGNAGNINITTNGDISISGSTPQSTKIFNPNSDSSTISSVTSGQGDAGRITIDTQNTGKLSLSNNADISIATAQNAVGNGNDISILAKSVDLSNKANISSDNLGGKGDAGNINIKTIGDISISGSTPQSTVPIKIDSNLSYLSSDTIGQGNAGKITLDTQDRGDLLLSNNADISSRISPEAVGNAKGISIFARSIDLRNQSSITSANLGGKGDAGNIDIKTIGDISISGSTPQSAEPTMQNLLKSSIKSNTGGKGNAGKITIDTQDRGKILLSNRATITNGINLKGIGNSRGISISAQEIALRNNSSIVSSNLGGKGDAGNIDIKTTGDVSLFGETTPSILKPGVRRITNLSFISSQTRGIGNTGKITIDTQNRGNILLDRSSISNQIGPNTVGNSSGIIISAREVYLRTGSLITSSNLGGTGDAGNININTTGLLELTNNGKLGISSNNLGRGKTGDISLTSDRISLNLSNISSESTGGAGGNIQLTVLDKLLLRKTSGIFTDSASSGQNGNGGNITINSPLIIALPGNNDIAANAVAGNGGKVNITSQGLFGIKYRPKGQESNFTNNDITASSRFGQSGTVNINTPGTDPGKDSTQLPNVPTDASNQIAQTCGASRENKFVVAGRGGIPANANDPLTSDVVWQDARGTNSQPTAGITTTDPTKLAPPATGLIFDGKGKATLIAAGTQGQPTGTSVVCTNAVKK
jgi:filamentous hemagglutinin family protein